MESDLFKQLEDKKKGCGSLFIDENGNDAPCKLLLVDRVEPEPHFCPTCKSNIAILEQAIAEIEKQKQNFIDIINSLGEIRGKSNDLQCIKLGESFSTNSVEWLKKELLKQLNQPKEEKDGS